MIVRMNLHYEQGLWLMQQIYLRAVKSFITCRCDLLLVPEAVYCFDHPLLLSYQASVVFYKPQTRQVPSVRAKVRRSIFAINIDICVKHSYSILFLPTSQVNSAIFS